MRREKLGKINNSFNGMLYRTVCFLLIVAIILAVWSVSGVYAKYVDSNNSGNSANVAGVGVEFFKLVQYGQTVAGINYSKVVPGADIPGPHIQLKIKSEVSYTLFLNVTVYNCPTYINDDGEEVDAVYFDLTADWEFVKSVENSGYTTSTYKYVVDKNNNVKNYVFKAGEEYSYVDLNEITVLKNDVIYVSERYSSSKNGDFSLKFDAYIQQVL